jgi:hypothetical protein
MARLDRKRRETLRGLIIATLGSGEDDDLVDGLMDICEQAFRAGVKHGEEKRRRDGQDAIVKIRARREPILALVRRAIAQYKAEAQRVLAGLRLALEDRARERDSDLLKDPQDDDDGLWRAADRELQNAARHCLRSLRHQVEESDEAALSDASRELVRPAFDTEDLLPELKLIRSGRYRQAAASPASEPPTPRAVRAPDLHLVDDRSAEIPKGHGIDPTDGKLSD